MIPRLPLRDTLETDVDRLFSFLNKLEQKIIIQISPHNRG